MNLRRYRYVATSRRTAAVTALGTLLAAGTLAVPGPAAADTGLDRGALSRSLDAVHEAGMYGVYSAVRDGDESWRDAAGVADVDTGRPAKPFMVHRVGSISKTFTAVALLRQVARGTVELDAPIGRYLPDLVPGERGRQITVRMLLNHTSHIADHVAQAFPSLTQGSTSSLDDNRFRSFDSEELVRDALAAPATGEPGAVPGVYSNTNYILAGLLLEKVTGEDAEAHITREVIRRAGLRHTSFPRTPNIPGPHSGAYESMYGLIDPPRDYSVYDMSWITTAGAVVSTMEDLNQFYRALLRGRLIGPAELAEMQKTVPVLLGGYPAPYGLGIYATDLPCGRFWGHSGSVFGMGTESMSSPDGTRQMSIGMNRTKYQPLDENGFPAASPIDPALVVHLLEGLCGPATARTRAAQPSFVPFAVDRISVKR
ncbi:serine hydrolase domain-containing protein [Nonomuraea terrae]|uniref:serine hydrolase domain-containing protein n=1 Tax=Nonomuraea terrae TaxID=2530383 RepID=UPI003789C9C8